MKLSDIAPTALAAETIELRGHQIDIHPLSIADIVTAARKNAGLIEAFFSDAENRPAAIVKAIFGLDRETINGILASATCATADQISAFKLSAIEEARILMKTAEVSIPEKEVEKLKTDASALAGRFGLTALGQD